MKSGDYFFVCIVIISVAVFLPATTFAGFQMKRFSLNISSQVSSSHRFDISAVAGQPDDSGILAGGGYQINGAGFWHENTDLIFKSDLD